MADFGVSCIGHHFGVDAGVLRCSRVVYTALFVAVCLIFVVAALLWIAFAVCDELERYFR